MDSRGAGTVLMCLASGNGVVVARLDWQLLGELSLLLAALAFLIGLGLWGMLRVRRWMRRGGDTLSPQEELVSHQSLLEQGLLTQEEFDRVRVRLEAARSQAEAPQEDAGPGQEAKAQDPPVGPS